MGETKYKALVVSGGAGPVLHVRFDARPSPPFDMAQGYHPLSETLNSTKRLDAGLAEGAVGRNLLS
jgi:hypothetical protein